MEGMEKIISNGLCIALCSLSVYCKKKMHFTVHYRKNGKTFSMVEKLIFFTNNNDELVCLQYCGSTKNYVIFQHYTFKFIEIFGKIIW
jgi:hypothetical protein